MNSRHPVNRFSQAKPTYVEGVDGTRSWYVDKDKLGRFFKVYRAVHVHRGRYTADMLRAARAKNGVGRPNGGYNPALAL